MKEKTQPDYVGLLARRLALFSIVRQKRENQQNKRKNQEIEIDPNRSIDQQLGELLEAGDLD